MIPIKVENIHKNYGEIKALKGVGFQVNEGEIFGLIGPDGAGKTTLMRMIVSLLFPDEGNILFMDRDVVSNNAFVRSHVGYMPQRFSLYQDLSVEENLLFFGDLFNVPKEKQHQRLERLYNFSRLGPFKKRFAGALSGGMKQKLALSCMLMHEPEIMILDEPTFGVDPVSRLEFWNILGTLRDQGITQVITTPYMDEAARCDRIALIYAGNILALDAPDKIIADFPYNIYKIASEVPHILFNNLKSVMEEKDIQLFADGVHVIDRNKMGINEMRNFLKAYLKDDEEPAQSNANLENIFLDLMHEQKEQV
ncbi:MAG: ABC transporter ATP-binding protein [Calditrichae bacterium]|nr:ABC transporter ATP-binding protein [Calditrichia bacterium]